MNLRVLFLPILLLATCAQVQAQWKYYPIEIPMRDGKSLAADVYTMDLNDPKPVILIQTPYNKAFYRLGVDIPQAAGGATFPLDTLNYNYVTLDWRGRFASTDAGPQGSIGEDGYDAVEWIATQPWSNGKVGTWGPSALGQVQYMTAKEHPPHLVCCVPLVKDYQTKYHDYFYGGVYRKEHVDALVLLGFLTTNILFDHPTYDNTWKVVELTTDVSAQMEVPMLVIGGWYDHFPDGVLRSFHDMKDRSDPSVRDQHKLLFGPWRHGGCVGAEQGILMYENAESIAVESALRFFDYHLRGAKNGWPLEPVVKYYQLGENEWRSTADWYGLEKKEKYFYLQPAGFLATTPHAESSGATFEYDPRDPSPSIGASRFTPFVQGTPIGPHDQAPVEARGDNIIFSTPVLTEDVEVNGPVTVELYLSSDRTDTDVAVRLCDVFPDGRSIIMTDGIKRMRLRNSLSTEELMQPGTPYPVSVELQNLGITFKKGHRIRIIVTSSDYPRFDLNINDGGPMYEDGDTLIATNTIHFGGEYPSRLILPGPSTISVAELPTASNLTVRVYPQPVSQQSVVLVQGVAGGELNVTVTDMLGRPVREIYQGAFNGASSYQLPSGLTPGTYFVTAKNGTSVVTQKLLITQ